MTVESRPPTDLAALALPRLPLHAISSNPIFESLPSMSANA